MTVDRKGSGISGPVAADLLSVFIENPEPVLGCEATGEVRFVNPAAEALLSEVGLAAEELLPADHESRIQAICAGEGQGANVEIGVLDRLFIWRYPGRPVAGWVYLQAREVTESRRTGEALRAALQDTRMRRAESMGLLAAARAILGSADLNASMQGIFEACKNLLGATAGIAVLKTTEEDEAEVVLLDLGFHPSEVDATRPISLTRVSRRIFGTGEAFFINDFGGSELAAGLPEGHMPLSNVLFAPMSAEGRVVGFLGFANKPGDFNENDAQMAASFGEQAAIAFQRREAQKELQLAATVFDEAGEGILITDADNKIVAFNKAAERITGYTAEEALGEEPRLLKSERHDVDFYRNMWTSLIEAGAWQGEIYNRRRDSGVYPQWTSITAVRGDDGQVTNYIAVFTDTSEKKLSEERIQYLAQHDALTSLPNRMVLRDRLQQALVQARAGSRSVVLLFFGLDRFKSINDSLGHPAGDAVLIETARRIAGSVDEGCTLARPGGDEFALLLPDLDGPEAAGQVAIEAAKRMADLLYGAMTIEDREVFVTASIGIAIYPQDAETELDLVKNAETAMYHAKEQGGGSYQFYAAEMNAAALKNLTLENDLRRGLERDELVVFYQPLVDAKTHKTVAAEALVRWMHPTRGLVPPFEFIPLAEETGLIVKLGLIVMQKAAVQNRAWRDAGLPPIRISINLSAKQFNQEDLVEVIEGILADAGLDPRGIEVEVTESTIMSDIDRAADTLTELQKRGIPILMDDFGTGYSSLAYLRRLPIDTLKIDRSFVSKLTESLDDAAIVVAMIQLAHTLGMSVVAEGVEQEQELIFLAENRCDEIQGFYFSKPVPAEEFEERLKREQ